MQKHPISIMLFSLLLWQCAIEPAPPQLPTTKLMDVRLLLLMEERQLEVWTQDSLSFSKWGSFPLRLEADYPIGLFDILAEKDSLRIVFKNDFYEKKAKLMQYPLLKEKYTPLLALFKKRYAKAILEISTMAPKASILVVTNDTRSGGSFKPCRNCPTWSSELQSQLQLELLDFSTPNRSK